MSAATPSRIRAWSSTVITRIAAGLVPILGLLFISSLSPLSPEPESPTHAGFAIRNAGGNNQLDFRPGPVFAPNFQVPAEAFGTLAHPWEPPVSRASASIGNFRINPTPIVSHAQRKLRIAVCNFRLDFLCLRVAKSVSQRLASNAVDFIAQHRVQPPLFPFHQHAHARHQAVAAL